MANKGWYPIKPKQSTNQQLIYLSHVKIYVVVYLGNPFFAMDTHAFNGCKTASATALYIHRQSKLVIRFIHGDDLILPLPLGSLRGYIFLFSVVVHWVISPLQITWGSFPAVNSLSQGHPSNLGCLSYERLYTKTVA